MSGVRWRPVNREDRQIALVWGVTAIGGLLLRPLWLSLAPLLPPCPFRSLTGVPCPSCGTTHAAMAMLDGHILTALRDNPLTSLLGILFVAGGVAAPIWLMAGGRIVELPSRLPAWARIAMVAVLLANWAWVIWRGATM